MYRSALPIVLGLMFASCHRQDEVERSALRLLAAAHSESGISAEMVDDENVELLRRLQLLLRTTLDTFDPKRLGAALAGEAGPDRKYAPQDRPRMQRERATRALRASTPGTCTAVRDDEIAKVRIAGLTAPRDHLPAEAATVQAKVASALHDAVGARLVCGHRETAVIFRRSESGDLRVVDLMSLNQGSFELNPNDPSLK